MFALFIVLLYMQRLCFCTSRRDKSHSLTHTALLERTLILLYFAPEKRESVFSFLIRQAYFYTAVCNQLPHLRFPRSDQPPRWLPTPLPSSALCLRSGDSWGSSPAWGSLSSHKCERCDCLLIQPVTFCHRSGSEISFR